GLTAGAILNPAGVPGLVRRLDSHGTARPARTFRGLRDRECGARLVERAPARPVCADRLDEGGQLGAVGRLEAVPEVTVGLRGRGRSGLDGADRGAPVVADGDAVVRSEHLEAHVIAEWITAGAGEDHEPAARQMQNGRGDVDVVELVDPRRVETGTVGVGLGDLLAAYEANRVEV